MLTAACRRAGVSEAVLAELQAEHGHDEDEHVGYLEELAETDDLRARARRGGIDLDREDER